MPGFKGFNIALTAAVALMLFVPVHWAVWGIWAFGTAGLWLVYLIQEEEKRREKND